MSAMASQINSLTTAYSTVSSCADQKNYQSSAPLAFVRGIHRWTVNSPHKGPVTRNMFPFDDVIMHTPKSPQLYSWSTDHYHWYIPWTLQIMGRKTAVQHQGEHQRWSLLALYSTNPQLTNAFALSQRDNNVENVSLSWRHHASTSLYTQPHPQTYWKK